MGKGDNKTKKGKIHNKSYGVSRPRPNKKKQNMNTSQNFYDYLDSSNFDCKSISDIQSGLKEVCQDIKQEDAFIFDFEWQIFNINKSFEYKMDKEKGTVNGLSYQFAGNRRLEDGTEIPHYFPDVSKLEKKDFEYCEKRYADCKNLFAKTEYGLMVYFGKQTDYSKRIDFKKQLCNELFTLAKEYYDKAMQGGERNYYDLDFLKTLELAFTIAEKAKLSDEVNTISNYIFDTQQNWNIEQDGTLRVLVDLSCLMSDFFKIFKEKVDFNKIISKNLEGAKKLEETNIWGTHYVIDKVLIMEQQLGVSQENSRRYKASIYEKMMADEENKNRCIVAVDYAEKALRLYQSLKDTDKINELNQKYNDLRGKIQLSKHYFELPKEYSDKVAENIDKAISESDENEILAYFIATPWYDSIEQIQKNADHTSKTAVLLSMTNTSILDKFGNTIDVFRTDEEIKEHNFWQAYTFNNQLGTQTMHQFFIEAYKVGKLNYQFLMSYLETTWLNDTIVRNYHSTQVEIRPLDTLKPSLKRLFSELELYFADDKYTFDSVTITDSLTLKIESILRNFCEKIGILTFKLRQKGSDKLVMEKLLDDILVDLKHSTENSTNFDEEDRLFIKYVMTEKTGLNLRNKVAHGLMDLDEYAFGNILLLFSIVMKLSKYKFTPIYSPDEVMSDEKIA
ncbi:hypothetical protein Barb7_00859 [Bacteroidales bacterium Barb7]|nr:hypothetical protein Barb7_00859 [Bacteroidales bacterium Barb7]